MVDKIEIGWFNRPTAYVEGNEGDIHFLSASICLAAELTERRRGCSLKFMMG